MKTIIRTTTTSNTGYELVTIDDQGLENIIAIDSTYKDEPFTLILPENPSNRKYFNSKKVDAAGGQIELTYKATRTLNIPNSPKTPTKKLVDYLTDDERLVYDEMMARCEERRKDEQERLKAAKNDPIEKARLKYEKYLAEYERLKAQSFDENAFEEDLD